MTMTHNLFPQSFKDCRDLLQQQNHVCVSNKAVSATKLCLCQQQTICVSNKAMSVLATKPCMCQQQSYVCVSNKAMCQQQSYVFVSNKALSVSATARQKRQQAMDVELATYLSL